MFERLARLLGMGNVDGNVGRHTDRHGWWRRFPGVGSRLPRPPGLADHPDPRLQPGARVRLRGKPELGRKVLEVEWHRHRQQFVYVVESSARPAFKPYWFADQLELA